MAQFRTDTQKLDQPTVTRYEVMMLSDKITPSASLVDAFGRLRVSNPFTLFESQHRYRENEEWDTQITGTGNTQHFANESAMHLNIDGNTGDKIIRETKKVFAYQPGKGLVSMNSFVFNPLKTGLRQRVGYFGANNGIYFEANGANLSIVLRSYSNGSLVETVVPQSQWNLDRFDGTGVSAQIDGPASHTGGIDPSKANLFWVDIEWLGVGDVRCGFLCNGRMAPAHVFHHDNISNNAYMTTAELPIRYEIENVGNTSSSSTMIQICSTVLSDGGYQGRNKVRTAGIDVNQSRQTGTAGTWLPLISIRLSSNRLDSIVIPKQFDLLGLTNNATYRYKIISNGVLTNSSFVDCYGNNVQYDVSANAITGGIETTSGYFVNGVKGGTFEFGSIEDFEIQLGRTIAGNSDIFTVAVQSDTNSSNLAGSISWYEIT
jgi:hypothetical protein